MNALYPSDWLDYLRILGVFFRLLGLFVMFPVFSNHAVSLRIRLLIALSLSLALFPIVSPHLIPLTPTIDGLLVLAVRESAVGLMLGFVGMVTFEAINLGAHYVGYQMGFGTVGMMDPQNNAQVSALVPLQGWISMVMFWVTELHHEVIRVIVESFKITSGANLDFTSNDVLKHAVALTSELFVTAVQLAAPLTLLILSTNIAMGVLGRMMPQLNLILFSFPITILLGLTGLYILAPEMLGSVDLSLTEISGKMILLLKKL